jgi:predicted transcriptional regulator
MRAKREYRDRADIEVAVLDALVDRADDGMTVFEVRAAVEADIDAIEDALGALKADGLIEVEHESERVRILPADRVVPDPSEELDEEESFIDAIRDRFGL